MVFELNDSIAADILHAMENQQQTCVLEAASGKVISAGEGFNQSLIDEENYYTLPVWTSADGYNLLESFVSDHKHLCAYGELKKVLAEGRGVFKSFKNTLKKYPEIERLFNSYKNKEMNRRVIEWYDLLRESWGLEKLDLEFDEYDDLVLEDFTFRPYNCSLDSSEALKELSLFLKEIKEQFPGESGFAVAHLFDGYGQISNCFTNENAEGFVCRTLTDDFAGCILYSFNESSLQKTAFLAGLFVNQNYRGLGIAAELLSQSIEGLKKDGIRYFIISNQNVPQVLESLLTRLGFVKKDFVFEAELS